MKKPSVRVKLPRHALLSAMTALLWFTAAPLAAQLPSDSAAPVIRAIELDRHNVFDLSHTHAFYARLMNALHVVTRPGVVRNELLLLPGQRFDSALAAETARNLRRLGIFQRAEVDTVRTDSGVDLRVVTQDGWSTKPSATFKSTGGEVSWSTSLVEENLLGTNTHLAARYGSDPDRTSVQFSLLKQRLIAHRLGLLATFQDLSDGKITAAQFGLPYLSLSARNLALLTVEDADVRVLEFRDGQTAAAADTVGRRLAIIRGDLGHAIRADPEGYLRIGLTLGARRDDSRNYNLAPPFTRSWYGDITATIERRRARYAVVRGFSSLTRDEDVDLSTTVTGGVAVAPAGLGYASTGIGPVLGFHTGVSLDRGFGYFDAHANGIYGSGGLDSGTATLGATVVLAPRPGHLFVAHADGGWKERPAPGDQFDLGLGIGPRAFPLHGFTGDREALFTVEYRVTAARDVLRLFDLGVALSADHGGAWYAGSPSRWGDNVGIGLRLGSVRATRPEATRFDLSWRFPNDVMKGGWVFSVGRGFTFALPTGQ